MMVKKGPEVVSQFMIPADFVSAVPYGSGHINDTFAVTMSQGGTPLRYILQRMNHRIFKRPDLLMENILRVTQADQGRSGDATDGTRRTLTVIPAKDGLPYVRDQAGACWRTYVFVENTCSYDEVETPEQTFQAARAFGRFQQAVADLGDPACMRSSPGFMTRPCAWPPLKKRWSKIIAAGLQVAWLKSTLRCREKPTPGC